MEVSIYNDQSPALIQALNLATESHCTVANTCHYYVILIMFIDKYTQFQCKPTEDGISLSYFYLSSNHLN